MQASNLLTCGVRTAFEHVRKVQLFTVSLGGSAATDPVVAPSVKNELSAKRMVQRKVDTTETDMMDVERMINAPRLMRPDIVDEMPSANLRTSFTILMLAVVVVFMRAVKVLLRHHMLFRTVAARESGTQKRSSGAMAVREAPFWPLTTQMLI